MVYLKTLDHMCHSLISLPHLFLVCDLFFWLTPQETDKSLFASKTESVSTSLGELCASLHSFHLEAGRAQLWLRGRGTRCASCQLTPGHMLSWSHYSRVPSSSGCVIGVGQCHVCGKNSVCSEGKSHSTS